MKKIVATPAPNSRTTAGRNAAWVYAGALTLLAVTQLFAFEKFIPLMDSYWLPGGHGTGTLAACLLVVLEVLAVPFLLRMPLSPLMRYVSKWCGLVVPLVWAILATYALLKNYSLTNGGMLGAEVKLPLAGQLVVSIGLFVLAIYATRELTPKNKR